MTNKIINKKEAMAELLNKMHDFLDKHPDMSVDDVSTYENMEADYKKMQADVSRLENLLEEQRRMMNIPDKKPAGGAGNADKIYMENFSKFLRGDMSAKNFLQESTSTKGGYLVPNEYIKELVGTLEEQSTLRQLCRVVNVSGKTVTVPTYSNTVAATWTAEGAAYTSSDESFGTIEVPVNKLTANVIVTDELLADSVFPLEAHIRECTAEQIAKAEAAAFINGDGTTKPKGLLTETGIASNTSAKSGAITFDDVIELYHSIREPYRVGSTFIMSDSAAAAIRKIKDANGQYIWQQSVTVGAPSTILGRPVRTEPNMPAYAAGNKAILFGDFSRYWILQRSNVAIKRLNEIYALDGKVAFACDMRIGGKCMDNNAFATLAIKA